MKPYAATGRHGKVNVRHFRNIMTHAVDVDGLVWKFFPSASAAEAYATERSVEGYDAVVVPAKPHQATDSFGPVHGATDNVPRPTEPPAGRTTFAQRFNDLLKSNPYSTEEFADALREEGVIMAAEIARRLMTGKGGLPPDSIIGAVARVFDVEPEYFFGPTTTESAAPPLAENSDLELNRETTSDGLDDDHTSTRQMAASSELEITLQEFGRMIEALSIAADSYLAHSHADPALAVALTHAVSQLGHQLGRARGGDVVMTRELLEEIVLSWARTGPSVTASRTDFLWAAELLGTAPS